MSKTIALAMDDSDDLPSRITDEWADSLSLDALFPALDRVWAAAQSEIVERYRQLSVIVGAIYRKGGYKRLQEHKLSMIPHFLKVASGQTTPEIIAELDGYPALLRKITTLPVKEQERLVIKGESVEIHQPGGTSRLFNVKALKVEQYQLVFGDGRLLKPDEQLARQTLHVVKPPTGEPFEAFTVPKALAKKVRAFAKRKKTTEQQVLIEALENYGVK